MNRYDTPITGGLNCEVWNWPVLHEFKKGDKVSPHSQHMRARFMFRISRRQYQPYEITRKVKDNTKPEGYKECTAYYLVASVSESVAEPGTFTVHCAGFDDGDFTFGKLSLKRKNFLIHLLTQQGRETDLDFVFERMADTKKPGEEQW